MGSERIAYMGVQVGWAFYLAVLQGYAPSTNVTEFRDRIVGILLGVVVMAVVFSYVWPVRAGSGMLQSLAEALRRMAQIGVGRGTVDPGVDATRAAAWHALDEASQMSDLYALEPEALTATGAANGARARLLIDLTRRVLLVQAVLLQHRAMGGHAAVDTASDAARKSFAGAVAEALDGVERRTETGVAAAHADLRTPLAALGASSRAAGQEATTWVDGELALCETLADRVEALQQAAGTR
jgi:multidrug resistance protein MdtO